MQTLPKYRGIGRSESDAHHAYRARQRIDALPDDAQHLSWIDRQFTPCELGTDDKREIRHLRGGLVIVPLEGGGDLLHQPIKELPTRIQVSQSLGDLHRGGRKSLTSASLKACFADSAFLIVQCRR